VHLLAYGIIRVRVRVLHACLGFWVLIPQLLCWRAWLDFSRKANLGRIPPTAMRGKRAEGAASKRGG